MTSVLDDLVGRRVTAVWWSEERITFDTDRGPLSYEVEGDCCSQSYLHDLHGLDKLLAGPVVSTNEVELLDSDEDPELKPRHEYDELTSCYGFQVVTVHPQWGQVTTALSFRNASNGYYGGWMERAHIDEPTSDQRKLDGDVVA